MSQRNPLRENEQPRDIINGEEIINIRTQKIVRIVGAEGNVQEFLLSAHDSRPDGNGSYSDIEFLTVPTDHAGNTLPEDGRPLAISHSGLFITSPEQCATCNSWLHGNRSRNVLLGQDGRKLPDGNVICSRCDAWRGTIYMLLLIVGVALILGILKGAWLF